MKVSPLTTPFKELPLDVLATVKFVAHYAPIPSRPPSIKEIEGLRKIAINVYTKEMKVLPSDYRKLLGKLAAANVIGFGDIANYEDDVTCALGMTSHMVTWDNDKSVSIVTERTKGKGLLWEYHPGLKDRLNPSLLADVQNFTLRLRLFKKCAYGFSQALTSVID